MNPVKRFFPSHTRLDENQANRLARTTEDWYSVSVKPVGDSSTPATLENTVKGVLELQTKWFGLRNTSPTIAYEIRRTTPDNLYFQFSLPTKRLERKLRTQLGNEVDGLRFDTGSDGLPVKEEDSIGGAILTPGRKDWYPLQTDFDFPPMNSVASSLHRHAMQDTRIIIQVLFQPVAGRSLRSWWRTRRTYQHIGFLRKQKEKLWGNRPPTPREKQQADAIERKAGTRRFHTTIRFLVVGAKEYTQSRVKELAGAFNIFENPDTGQYLNTVTIRSPLPSRIHRFAATVNNRRFGYSHRGFQASIPELAGLTSIPTLKQENIQQ